MNTYLVRHTSKRARAPLRKRQFRRLYAGQPPGPKSGKEACLSPAEYDYCFARPLASLLEDSSDSDDSSSDDESDSDDDSDSESS